MLITINYHCYCIFYKFYQYIQFSQKTLSNFEIRKGSLQLKYEKSRNYFFRFLAVCIGLGCPVLPLGNAFRLKISNLEGTIRAGK